MVDAEQYYSFLQNYFMVDRTKTTEGCIGVSEKWVFHENVICRVAAEQLKCMGSLKQL